MVVPGGDYQLDIQKLIRATRDNGFTMSFLRIKAVGLVIEKDGKPAFKITKTDQVYYLEPNEKLQELQKAIKDDKKPVAILASVPLPKKVMETGKGDIPKTLVVENYLMPAN